MSSTMGMLIHCSPKSCLQWVMSFHTGKKKKVQLVQRVSTLLKNNALYPCFILLVTAFQNYGAPQLESKGWETQHKTNKMLIPLHVNATAKRKETSAERAIRNLTCLFRTRCFPFQYFSIWSACSVLTMSTGFTAVSWLISANQYQSMLE